MTGMFTVTSRQRGAASKEGSYQERAAMRRQKAIKRRSGAASSSAARPAMSRSNLALRSGHTASSQCRSASRAWASAWPGPVPIITTWLTRSGNRLAYSSAK